jgi:hypothetical protein
MNFYIFGLGAIGSNLLVQLSKRYKDAKFYGIDYDIVEDRNIDTQAYLLHQIGKPKALAMAIVIGLRSRNYSYTPIERKIISAKDVKALVRDENSIVIDCFDNSESRSFISGKNCLHVGFSPQYAAEMIWDENYSVPGDIPEDQNDICEVTEAIPFINFVVSLACMNIINFVDNNQKRDIIVTNKTRIQEL